MNFKDMMILADGELIVVEELYADIHAINSTGNKGVVDGVEKRVELSQTGRTRTKEDNHPIQPTLLIDGESRDPTDLGVPKFTREKGRPSCRG